MIHFVRAAGISAALALLAGGVAYADPSFASESEALVTTSSYHDHAAASLELDLDSVPEMPADSADNPPEPEADFAPQHAVATIEEAPEDAKRTLDELVALHASTEAASAEQECLAGAVYFESKGESLLGQLAVAEVVINRSRSGRFPTSICGVVKQKSQFSFVRGGRIPAVPKSTYAWRTAIAIAHIAQQDLAASNVSEALFFHASRVHPGWGRHVRLASVGNHIFYR
jgi:spore germination cell wall hydrolase CwlJ-like protein